MKNTFETKENYLKMKTRWAQYFNTEARQLERDEYGYKQRKLTAFHFALYAILQDKNPLKGLTSASGDTWDLLDYKCSSHKFTFYQKSMKAFFEISDEQTEELFSIARHYFSERKTFIELHEENKELEYA